MPKRVRSYVKIAGLMRTCLVECQNFWSNATRTYANAKVFVFFCCALLSKPPSLSLQLVSPSFVELPLPTSPLHIGMDTATPAPPSSWQAQPRKNIEKQQKSLVFAWFRMVWGWFSKKVLKKIVLCRVNRGASYWLKGLRAIFLRNFVGQWGLVCYPRG